jgi:hypothetical protein
MHDLFIKVDALHHGFGQLDVQFWGTCLLALGKWQIQAWRAPERTFASGKGEGKRKGGRRRARREGGAEDFGWNASPI